MRSVPIISGFPSCQKTCWSAAIKMIQEQRNCAHFFISCGTSQPGSFDLFHIKSWDFQSSNLESTCPVYSITSCPFFMICYDRLLNRFRGQISATQAAFCVFTKGGKKIWGQALKKSSRFRETELGLWDFKNFWLDNGSKPGSSGRTQNLKNLAAAFFPVSNQLRESQNRARDEMHGLAQFFSAQFGLAPRNIFPESKRLRRIFVPPNWANKNMMPAPWRKQVHLNANHLLLPLW